MSRVRIGKVQKKHQCLKDTKRSFQRNTKRLTLLRKPRITYLELISR